jgi:hypothetical protein
MTYIKSTIIAEIKPPYYPSDIYINKNNDVELRNFAEPSFDLLSRNGPEDLGFHYRIDRILRN